MNASLQRALTIRKETFWNIFKVVLALALVGVVFSQTNISSLTAAWSHASLPWLLASLGTYCAITWTLARRYWLLIGKQAAFSQLLGLVIVQTSLGNLIATSAGSVSYVALLRGRYQVTLQRSVVSLLIARFGDMLVITAALTLSSLVVWSQVESLHWLVFLLLGLTLAGVCFLLVLYVFRQRSIETLGTLLRRLRVDRTRGGAKVMQIVAALRADDLQAMRALVNPVIGYSVLYLVLNLVFAYCNAQLFRVPIGVWPLLFMLALTQIMGLIPIQVFGGLGVFDVTSIYLYSLFGFSQSEITPMIIGARIVFYVLNLLLLLYLPLESRLSPAPSSSQP